METLEIYLNGIATFVVLVSPLAALALVGLLQLPPPGIFMREGLSDPDPPVKRPYGVRPRAAYPRPILTPPPVSEAEALVCREMFLDATRVPPYRGR